MAFADRRRTVSISMFLEDGTADGVRLVDLLKRNVRAVMCPRSRYPALRVRPGFSKPGIYLLLSSSPSGCGPSHIGIGQADVARNRLDVELQNRASWTHLILCMSQDTTLNEGHVLYLASRLIELATKAGRVQVEHDAALLTPFLSEADRATAEAFLRDMLLIYAVLGVTVFEAGAETSGPAQPERQDALRLKAKDAEATGRDTPEGFIVFKGSKARAVPVDSLQATYKNLRSSLLESGVFVPHDRHWVLTRDYRFNSPSQAAIVFAGRSASGWTEWKDERGRTLRELQALPVRGHDR